ncbi:MAG TPA: WGR domain-containing protein, partial [Myxococcota bacterium]
MPSVKAWRINDASQPAFPDEFDVVKKAVLQLTDIKNNNNKYYGIELHQAGAEFRVFTHYGRTDDLDNDPNAGARESRYFPSLGLAQGEYDRIYKEKTAKSKGYKEVALASSKIGSAKARGSSSGHVDDKTLNAGAGAGAPTSAAVVAKSSKPSSLPEPIQDLVQYIYAEATTALTTTVAVKITANGIETPLGVLTVGQVEKGEELLDAISDAVKN